VALTQALGNRAAGQLLRREGAETSSPSVSTTKKTGSNRVYATIKGEKQGKFTGNTGQVGREDQITVSDFRFNMRSPRDVATGQTSGKRQYEPVTFTKEWDEASEQLTQALHTNETLEEVRFEFTRPGADGTTATYRTVVFKNASVTALDDLADEGGDRQRVSLVFESFESTTGSHSTSERWSDQK
jgi:type VI secretion system secreted protein Hcp